MVPALPEVLMEWGIRPWNSYHIRQRTKNAKRRYKLQVSRMQRNEFLILAKEKAVRRLYEGDICPGL
jgi:hypothetical protein